MNVNIFLTKDYKFKKNDPKSTSVDTFEDLYSKLSNIELELRLIESYYLKKYKKTTNNNILFFNKTKYNNALINIDKKFVMIEYLNEASKVQLLKEIESDIYKLEHCLNFEKEILTTEEF